MEQRLCPTSTVLTTPDVTQVQTLARRRHRRRHRHTWCTFGNCVCVFCLAQILTGSAVITSRFIHVYPSCEFPSCYNFKSVLARSLNLSQSPCDNFYHFVCDGWKAESPPHWIIFSELQSRVASSAINTLLRVRRVPARRQTAIQKAAAMFRTCIQVLYPYHDRTANLKNFLKTIGLLNVNRDNVDVFDITFDLSLNWNIAVFFYIVSDRDTKDTQLRTLHFRRNRQLMEWFLRRSRMDGRTLHRAILSTSQLIGQEINPESLIFMENYLITTLSAMSHSSNVVMDVKLSDLDAFTPPLPWVEWAEVMNRHLPEKSQISGNDIIQITDMEYFRSVADVIIDDRRKHHNLVHFVVWYLVQYLGIFTSLPLVEPAFNTLNEARNYVFARCYEEVNYIMPYAFGAPFAVQAVPPDTRKEVRNMVQKVKDALEESFRESSWMDNATKQIAIFKLHSMKVVVAYPDYVLDGLDQLYSSVPDAGPVFLESRLKTWFIYRKIEKDKLFKRIPSDRLFLDFRLTDVNAFYQPGLNVMIIPAGIINPPFYQARHPVSANFGGLGHVVAHEIVHGFDVESSLRDARGDVRDWWTSETRLQYEDRVRCLKEMYEKTRYSVNRQEGSESENIADFVGLAQAHKAYRSMVKKGRGGSILKGLTANQAFYVVSCFKWCSNRMEPGRGYSADELRCNVPLKNIPDFAKEFRCKKNDPMNPMQKCNFW
ncbi:endothelin-converting enzyme 2-like [Ornithodoros turicata]|uniref:endothelin-converting enzyme 2-like n=1 Tax=Ornithodoros turicata TaxID=34597 RepID=UPI00313A26CA